MLKDMKILKLAAIFVLMVGVGEWAYANDLVISNVSLDSRNPATKTLIVEFDVSWKNSWRNKINHDAVWLTVRLNSAQAVPVYKKLCQISLAGLNPSGSSVGTVPNLEFYVPKDKNGVFLRRSFNGSVSDIFTQNAQLTINYDSCGYSDSDEVYASVFGLEMIFVPLGAFYAGDYNASAASLNKGVLDNRPWQITSEGALAVANVSGNGFRYVSSGHESEFATGASFSIPASYPKGYQAFYVMKYELNEGQWVEFLNSLPSAAARASRDLTDNAHKGSDGVMARNTISCSGSLLTCSTTRPHRAVGFLQWMDLAAFLDWNALRPMTELEFEKVSRGPLLPVPGEYIWGGHDIVSAQEISVQEEDGSEVILTQGANARFDNIVLTGGDAHSGVELGSGPLRNGIFATSASTRTLSGSGYYGIMDLGGNVKERVITIGNVSGLIFTGLHGDGILSSTAGFEGNANTSSWPGMDTAIERGVTGESGTGFRGGSWVSHSDKLRISDRSEAASTTT